MVFKNNALPLRAEKHTTMTQIVLKISDRSIVSDLRKVLSRIGGVEDVKVIHETKAPSSKRQKFLGEFRHAAQQAKDFKEGKVSFGSWEDMMNEL